MMLALSDAVTVALIGAGATIVAALFVFLGVIFSLVAKTHRAVNANLGAHMRVAYLAAKRVVLLGGANPDPTDIAILKLAEENYFEHEKQLAAVDKAQGRT